MRTSRNAASGALLGLAVGDALGTTNEFENSPTAPMFPKLATGPHTTITGDGPFAVKPGQVTDDTQMAAALAASLITQELYDVNDAAARYVAWRHVAFDVGGQTAGALSLIGSGVDPKVAAKKFWTGRSLGPAGNGSLMRTAPIAVYFSADAERRREASFADSAITHFDPRCQLACASFNAAIAACCQGDPALAEILAVADAELDVAAKTLLAHGTVDAALISSAKDALRVDLKAARDDDPHLYEGEVHLLDHAGFVRVAFRLAFWELAHAPTFEAALIDVVNRGGDADTNGAITGALLGAHFGDEGIPQAWKDLVLGALAGETSPLATTYHPKVLVDFLAALPPSSTRGR